MELKNSPSQTTPHDVGEPDSTFLSSVSLGSVWRRVTTNCPFLSDSSLLCSLCSCRDYCRAPSSKKTCQRLSNGYARYAIVTARHFWRARQRGQWSLYNRGRRGER